MGGEYKWKGKMVIDKSSQIKDQRNLKKKMGETQLNGNPTKRVGNTRNLTSERQKDAAKR